ncbi:MAG: DNA polymerase III subunit epsilon [Rhodobacteraceae bacterium]|nr:DNA polymerase III subunit epsilon [Paracoccaceae bacterium]
MREIVMDTETTGLDPFSGDRVVEIGGVELLNHLPTGRIYHQYINPERDMPQGAFDVHGLSSEFLSDKPVFKKIGQDFLDFVDGAKMVIHNATFDMKFLNAEFEWMGLPKLPMSQSIDTLAMARRRFPGAQNSLDALCRRFGVDNSAREKHGALLDSEILAEVYLELIGGRQPDFALNVVAGTDVASQGTQTDWKIPQRAKKLPPRMTEAEKQAHGTFVQKLGEGAFWSKT